jgi:DHA3 family macrolide efflux protein-like MFS transporter
LNRWPVNPKANTEKDFMKINWKKNTILFLSGQSISLFGSLLVQYAIVWHITLKSQSGSAITLFVLAGILPTFFISPFGGVWADRFNRKLLINLADGAIALVSLITGILLLSGMDSIALLFACSVARALGQGVHTPALNSFVPQIVPEEHLTRVNGINGSIQSAVMLIAPMLSGVLLTFASIGVIFFIDVITAAIGISVVFFLVKTPEKNDAAANIEVTKAGTPAGINYFSDLAQGFRYIRNHRYIFRLIIISTVFLIAVSPAAFLTPLQVTRNFGADVWRLTVIETCFSVGMMAGGILVSVWGGFKNRVYSMALSCACFGISAVALGLVKNFPLYACAMAFAGLVMPLYNAPSMALLQTSVESAYQGRVFGVFGMVSSLVMPAGMMLFGPLGDVVPIDYLLIATGIIIMLLSISFVTSKVIREAGAGRSA